MVQPFDLQAHSTASDGALPPAQVVRAAHAAGIRLLALTDHDTVAGIAEARDAAADLTGMTLVPAVEISALDDDLRDLHVCGYGIDPDDVTFRDRLESWQADRRGRADRMVAALRDLGWAVDDGVLAARRGPEGTIGRPHVAAATFGHPDNAERIAAEGLSDPTALLIAYLTPGAPAYRDRTRPSVADAISAIHDAGGVAVWAHPFWDVDDRPLVLTLLDRFVALGLDGVEAFYATFDADQTAFLVAEATARGLLTTGSSDFHAPDHPTFSRFGAFSTFGMTPNLGPIGT